MPKQSFGPTSKKRTQTLLMALVQFANDALEIGDEKILVGLQAQIKTHWQTEKRLVVRTTARHLVALTQCAATPLTLAQVKASLKHLQTFVGILEDHRTSQRGSDRWHFTLTLWHHRWEDDANQQAFDQVWEQHHPDLTSPSPKHSEPTELDRWRSCCRVALDTRLTTNPLTAGTGLAFDLTDVYCPVGVVAYQTDKASSQSALSQTGQEFEEEGFVFQPDEFLTHILAQPEVQRLAIVGEPGAGKTTLLQTLALKLLEREQLIPIWISLADLEGQSLEPYLLETWLKQTLRVLTVPPTQMQAFAQQFSTGKVWLLLDAVDEMGMVPSQALSFLAKQLKGWLAEAHVILTSRSQLWDTNNNALETFTPYRSLSFSYQSGSNQVQTVIQSWFQDQPQLGDTLYCQVLRPELRRLKALIKNPLYLALLCRTWQLTQGQLPETKAMLYRQFVDALYDWKQDVLPTSLSQRQQLNQALAALALQAMSQSPPLFRLTHDFVSQRLDPDQLTLALQLGWLQPVGWSPATGDKVYAFYHATFQEYFAAQALNDWQQFVEFQTETETLHPIFIAQWQEVVLLWLGRSDIAAADKTELMKTLIDFTDGCGEFYEIQAKFLATKGLAEFPGFSGARELLIQVVNWRFKQQKIKPTVWVDPAGEALAHSDRKAVIQAIEQFVRRSPNPFEQWLAAHSLGKNYDVGNEVAIATLETLLPQAPKLDLKIEMAKSLADIQPGHPLALQTLVHILQSDAPPVTRRKAAHRLGKIDPGNQTAFQTLEQILQATDDAFLQRQTLHSLQQLVPDYPAGKYLEVDQKRSPMAPFLQPSRRRVRPQKPQLSEQQLISILEQKLLTSKDAATRIRHAGRLGQLCPHHPEAVQVLLHYLRTSQKKAHLKQASDHLLAIIDDPEQPQPLPTNIKQILPQIQAISLTALHSAPYQAAYKLLWHWSKTLPYPKFRDLWQSKLKED